MKYPLLATKPWLMIGAANILCGCAASPPSIVQSPMLAPPNEPPIYIEKINTGSIYQPGMATASLFSGDKKPGAIGDTLKISIAEKFSASNKVNTDNSRANQVTTKGPNQDSGGVLGPILGVNATASGSDSYKGKGSTDNAANFTAQITVSVINVLPNGHLVVAGERAMLLNGSATTLRISGVVNPKDLKLGNVVASDDVLNAHFEAVGQGDVADASSRTWLQRLLTKSMQVW
ncbi:flagellar basal body L-ring protein FlgH [Aquabacterium sp.]|uniref:flagellar basal body L-ring protein FlgH n=1 Tax=Aquabacterium sp. TaxID=1872578 RepID=UPI0035B0EAA3